VDRALLITAFVMLVVAVMWLSAWIKSEFDQAQEDRCAVAWVTSEFTALNLLVAELQLDPADLTEVIDATVAIEQALEATCGPPP
jgi:hypothetical protein